MVNCREMRLFRWVEFSGCLSQTFGGSEEEIVRSLLIDIPFSPVKGEIAEEDAIQYYMIAYRFTVGMVFVRGGGPSFIEDVLVLKF